MIYRRQFAKSLHIAKRHTHFVFDAQDYAARALSPEEFARAYDFPDLEDAMPKSKPHLLSPWGWSVVATAIAFGLILFVIFGQTE